MTTYATAAKALPATFKFRKYPDGLVCTASKKPDGEFYVSWNDKGYFFDNSYSEQALQGFLSDDYEILEDTRKCDSPVMETFQFTCPKSTYNADKVFTYTQTSALQGVVTWDDGHEEQANRGYSLVRAKGYIQGGDWLLVKPLEEEYTSILEASTAATSAWQHHIEQLDKDAEYSECIVSIDDIKSFTEHTGAHVHIFENGYTLGYKDDFYDVVTDVMLVTVMDAIRTLDFLSMRTEEDYEPCDCCECNSCDYYDVF